MNVSSMLLHFEIKIIRRYILLLSRCWTWNTTYVFQVPTTAIVWLVKFRSSVEFSVSRNAKSIFEIAAASTTVHQIITLIFNLYHLTEMLSDWHIGTLCFEIVINFTMAFQALTWTTVGLQFTCLCLRFSCWLICILLWSQIKRPLYMRLLQIPIIWWHSISNS